MVPAPLPRTVLVGTTQGRRDVSDGDDEAIVNGFTIAGSIDIDEVAGLSVEGIRRQLVSARADTLLLCGQLDDETFATVVRAAMMAECSVLATARRLALPGIRPKVLWRRGRPFIEMRAVALRWQQLLVKRVLDLVLASALLVILAPLMLAVAVALIVGSPGPVVFGQRRLGRYGRSFRCFKFRSMYTDAEQRLQSDPELHAEYVRNGFKLPDGEDPRITPLGRILRRTSLDELPQLWNVLRGEMALVGPRPDRAGRDPPLRRGLADAAASAAGHHRPVAGERPQQPRLSGAHQPGAGVRRGLDARPRSPDPRRHRARGAAAARRALISPSSPPSHHS